MRNNARVLFIILFLLFFTISVGGGLYWANLNYVQRTPLAPDYYAIWKPARNFLVDQITPYGDLTTLNVQNLIYGRAARSTEIPYRYNMPFYAILLAIPVAAFPNPELGRAAWMILLEVAAVGLVILSLQNSRWKTSWYILLPLMLFGVFWMPVFTSILSGSTLLLQALCAFGAIRAAEQDADELAGALAAFGFLNIEATLLVILLILVWAAAAGRGRILAGFFMTITLLLGLAFLVFPGWFVPFFFAALFSYMSNVYTSVSALFTDWFPGFGGRLAQTLAALTIGLQFVEWRTARDKDTRWLYWTACLAATLTPLLGRNFSPIHLTFALPAILLVVSVMDQRWGVFGRILSILMLLGAFVGLWAAALNGLTAIFLLVFPFLLAIMLYWVRWWAIRPPRLWIDIVTQRR